MAKTTCYFMHTTAGDLALAIIESEHGLSGRLWSIPDPTRPPVGFSRKAGAVGAAITFEWWGRPQDTPAGVRVYGVMLTIAAAAAEALEAGAQVDDLGEALEAEPLRAIRRCSIEEIDAAIATAKLSAG